MQLSGLGTASLDLGVDHSLTALTLLQPERFGRDGAARGEVRGRRLPGEVAAAVAGADACGSTSCLATTATCSAPGCGCAGRAFTPSASATSPIGARWPTAARAHRAPGPIRADRATAIYSHLRQDDLGGSVSLRFPLWAEGWGTVGALAQLSTRDFGVRRLRTHQEPAEPRRHGIRAARSRSFCAPERIGTLDRDDGGRPSRTTATSRGRRLFAGYAMLETPIFGRLSGAGGVRARGVHPEGGVAQPVPGADDRRAQDAPIAPTSTPLPGVALKYELTKSMLLRAAYGMTVSRPQIRELAPYQYYDFLRDRGIEGNPDLKRTLIQNARSALGVVLRRGADRSAVRVLQDVRRSHRADRAGQHDRRGAVQNAKSARNLGGELEMRLRSGTPGAGAPTVQLRKQPGPGVLAHRGGGRSHRR